MTLPPIAEKTKINPETMHNHDKSRQLRERAESILKSRNSANKDIYSAENLGKLIEELQIYQIELETQNEEMQRLYSALETSSARYTSLFDFAPIGYLTTDENDLIQEINLTGCEILGMERQLIVGLAITRFFSPDSQDNYYFHVRKVRETATKQITELALQKRPGSEVKVPAFVQLISLPDENGSGIKSAFIDITQRKLAAENLKENEARLNSIFRATPAGIGMVINRELTLVNDRLCDMLGYDNQELIGKSTRILFPSDEEFLRVGSENYARLERESISLMTSKFQHKNGKIIDVLLSTSALENGNSRKGVTFTALDISRQLDTEKSLVEVQLKFEMIASNARDGILLLNRDGSINYFNPSVAKLFGYESKTLEKLRLLEIIEPDQNSEVITNLFAKYSKAKVRSRITRNFELSGKKSDGTVFPLELSLSSFVFGAEVMLVAIIRDFTEHKITQYNLMKAKEKAEESERLKTAFLANVSHEIRTPMNAILGFVSLMQEFDSSFEEREEYFYQIKTNGEILMNLINDIIDLSKLESDAMSLYPEQLEIRSFVEEIYSFLVNELRLKHKNNEIVPRLIFPEELAFAVVLVDRLRLRQVLTNLIQNAVKFTQKGSISLIVSTDNFDDNSRFNLIFNISDTGIGIERDKTTYIFDSFRQVEDPFSRKYGGAGLGLSIVKKIVESMGGRVEVNSVYGKGSDFVVKLPVEFETGSKDENSSGKNPEFEDYQGCKALVVEDKYANSKYLQSLLTKSGIHVLLAESGEEAVAVFGGNPDIDIVLMDIQLPGMDGFDAASRIRMLNRNVPVIAQTAFATSENQIRFKAAGFNDYVSKPINARELLKKIAMHLKKR